MIFKPKTPLDAEMNEPLRINPGAIVMVAVVIIVLVVAMSSFYTIQPDSVGIVMRLGRYHVTSEPGLHFKLPLGIDRVTPVPTSRQQKEEFGYRTLEAGVRSKYLTYLQEPILLEELLMITGDLNMAMVEWTIQYRISDPKDFLFNVRHPVQTLRDATESVMREVIGDRTVDEILTIGRQEAQSVVQDKLQALITNYQMGLRIDRVIFQGVNPPEKRVQDAFNEVNEAKQERERSINEARADYNQIIPRTRGEALQKIQEAEGYATQRVNRATGDAARFNAMLAAYLKAPEVTRSRIYLETMGKVIPKLGKKYVIDKENQQILPLLQLVAEEATKP